MTLPTPLDTRDVRDTEIEAAALVATSEVQAAAEEIKSEWRTKMEARIGELSPQTLDRLDLAISELMFTYAQRAANGDPARPRISWTECPPHEWDGVAVQGGRYAGDNPDNVYRLAPVDGLSSYVVEGRLNEAPPSHGIFELTDVNHRPQSPDTLQLLDLERDEDGQFTITISPEPADGRPNHLQSTPAVEQLFIRDTLGDWATQSPADLRIRRVSGPDSAPHTFEQQVARTIEIARVAGTLWIDFFILWMTFSTEANEVPQPQKSPSTISRSCGWFRLAAGEALVITKVLGDCWYTGFAVQDVWTVTADHWSEQTSLANGQAVPNPDGTLTFVLSATDPGVHNWVSTGGLEVGSFLLRWQGAALLGQDDVEFVRSEVVKLDELSQVLPAGTVYVTPAERAAQLEARRAGFLRRIATRG